MKPIRKGKIELSLPQEFYVMGIACHEKPFSLCWEINRIFDAKMVLQEPFYRKRKELGDDLFFTTFGNQGSDSDIIISLVENITADGFFFERNKSFQYLLIVSENISILSPAQCVSKLKKSEMVIMAAEITLTTKFDLDFFRHYI